MFIEEELNIELPDDEISGILEWTLSDVINRAVSKLELQAT